MIKRQITPELIQAAKEYPIVTIIGPRQSGKTTLAKMTFPEYDYCSLEDPDIRQFAINDPRSFLTQYSHKVIFDEIQRVPELLSYLQGMVDKNNTKGQFILTGSYQLKLRAEVTQSLAGRTALLTLLPLSIAELCTIEHLNTRDELLYRGFFPRIYNDNLNPTRAYSNYYQTYVERDVRQLINLKDVSIFEKFIKLLAGRVGQIINLNSLSNDVGVSSTTLKEWLSVLEASFIIIKLQPYYENFGKRVVKSPKYYFIDTGLLAFLLGIEKPSQISRDPLVGQMFENLVVIECLKTRANQGLLPNLYFYRDSNGNEADILYKHGRELTVIEVKSSSTYKTSLLKGLKKITDLSPTITRAYLIYAGEPLTFSNNITALKYNQIELIFC